MWAIVTYSYALFSCELYSHLSLGMDDIHDSLIVWAIITNVSSCELYSQPSVGMIFSQNILFVTGSFLSFLLMWNIYTAFCLWEHYSQRSVEVNYSKNFLSLWSTFTVCIMPTWLFCYEIYSHFPFCVNYFYNYSCLNYT